MKAKDRHRDKLLRYLANPDNDWPNRGGLSIAIGLKEETFRTHFNAADIDEMEATGLALRRRRCSSQSALVDKGLMKRAKEGDPAACKLYYQRIECWSEKQIHENSFDEKTLKVIFDNLPAEYIQAIHKKITG